MQNCSQRLAKAVRLIELLDARRQAAQDPHWGSNIERLLVDRELQDLEHEIARNPGPLVLQHALLQRRRSRSAS